MKNKKLLALIGLIGLALVAGYFIYINNGVNQNNNRLKVSTSFYPLYFFTQEIGGSRVAVTNITPSGSEPHDYDPTTGDIIKIGKSKLLVLNGGVESWGNKIKDTLKGSGVVVVTAGEGLLNKQLTENGETSVDPHVWLDPVMAKKEADNIYLSLIKIDPTNKAYYQENEKNLNEKLDKLDSEYKRGLASCVSKDVITSHAAFGYIAARYGLNQVAISGISPDAEPSAQQLVEVAKFAKDHKVKYIFFESLVSPKLSETIAREVGAQTLVLDPIEGIAQEDINRGQNYFSLMQGNLKNLRIALNCN